MAGIRRVFALLAFSSILALQISANRNQNSAQRPNIVFILTDDQDTQLGGMDPMVKTRRLLGEKGMTFRNMFVNNPICCPSRASILTGQHTHNTQVYNNSIAGNCSSTFWQEQKERSEAFPPHVRAQGYKTFFAGKYLNQYGLGRAGGVEHIPNGWDEWNGLVGNSVYYAYRLSANGVNEKHGQNYEKDYLTDLIARRARKFLDKQTSANPFFMMLSTPACHAPNTPAPQYNTKFALLHAPRTPSFNTHASDKHWLVRQPPNPMLPSSVNITDSYFRNRWRTLLSVDDMVENIVGQLESKGMLDNTYIVFASDNGFHLGQFSMPIDKRHLYEFDIRVPLIIRGPGIRPNTVNQQLVMNIDLAPTFLDLIGVQPLASMDGKSLRPLLLSHAHNYNANRNLDWRNHMLIEHFGQQSKHERFCPSKEGRGVSNCFPDCICQDAVNNTYACVRGLHDNNNYIYCEFRDNENFREFYDIMSDPDQLQNSYKQLSPQLIDTLHHLVARLKTCRGRSCDAAERVQMPTVMTSSEENLIEALMDIRALG